MPLGEWQRNFVEKGFSARQSKKACRLQLSEETVNLVRMSFVLHTLLYLVYKLASQKFGVTY